MSTKPLSLLDEWWYDVAIVLRDFADGIASDLPPVLAKTTTLTEHLERFEAIVLKEIASVLREQSQYNQLGLGEPVRRERFIELGDRAAIIVVQRQAEWSNEANTGALVTAKQVAMSLSEGDEAAAIETAKRWTGGRSRASKVIAVRGKAGSADLYDLDEFLTYLLERGEIHRDDRDKYREMLTDHPSDEAKRKSSSNFSSA